MKSSGNIATFNGVNVKILIVGTGYVGLVTGACFAEMGREVICLDIDKEKIDKLKRGEIPIFEPGLEEIVKRNCLAGRLHFTTDYEEGLEKALFCFLALPTPAGRDGKCNLSYVMKAVEEIARKIDGYKIIVNKSTVPVGTASEMKERMSSILEQRGCTFGFDIVSNPEFLKEGDAINDFMKPDRIVIGAENGEAARLMRELYSPFNSNRERLMVMTVRSAEMTKYAANAMLALRISFMNEIATICEKVGADVTEVRRGVGSDTRIGTAFLYAGAGYGGSCFPKDVKALIALAKELAIPPLLIEAAHEVNERQKQVIGEKIAAYFEERGGLKGKTIAILGLSFKPGTDDMREAPSLELVRFLITQGTTLHLYDPIAMDNAKRLLGRSFQMIWCKDEFEAVQEADAIVLMTEWKQFRLLDFSKILPKMRGRAFFDGRNQYTPQEMASHGFDYFSIGRAPLFHHEQEVVSPQRLL